METFPLFLRSKQCRALIVGGGSQATAKARLLNQATIQPSPSPRRPPATSFANSDRRSRSSTITSQLGYFPELLKQHDLVVDRRYCDADEAAQIAEQARQRQLPVNVVDQPSLCSFFFSAIVDRSPMTVAIGSQGSSPILTHYVRRRIETSLPGSLDKLAELTVKHRDKVKQVIPSSAERLQFWESLLDGDLPETLRAGEADADQRIEQALDNYSAGKANSSTVFLVGAGPGDPDLLTVKALRIIQQADVIVYDRLVSDEIMNLTRRDAERIDVGKTMGNHTLPQEQINQLLVKLSRQGKRVVRLKGGDPFIFGRGGEEVEELLQEGIRFQVVPGITAASGSSTYCGIPLTHRDHAQSVTFVTGHLKTGKLNLDWPHLAQPHQTVVFYMGLTALSTIADELQAHGMPADTPVALVYKATRADQRLLVGQLDNIAELKEQHQFKSPSLIIVGTVVSMAERLNPQ